MKPSKNQFYCNDCGKIKMRFETEKNANTFLKFNADEIEEQSGHRPIRSYYCIACNSWHITSKKDIKNLKSKTEVVLEIYKKEMDEKKIISEKPEEKKIEHSQPKDFILKQTKAKRDKLKKYLNTMELNIDMIKKLWKTKKTYECNQILNDSYALINVFNKTILELEIEYESKMKKSEIIEVFSERQRRKNDLESILNELKAIVNNK